MGTKGPENVSSLSDYYIYVQQLSAFIYNMYIQICFFYLLFFIFMWKLIIESPADLRHSVIFRTRIKRRVVPQPQVEVLSEEEGEEEDEEEDILSLAEEKYRPAALEKMIALIALLVEQSRSERYESRVRRKTNILLVNAGVWNIQTILSFSLLCRHLTLSQSDMAALTGGKGFPFLFQHIRDGINIRQTCNLIFSLCRYNNRLAEHVRPHQHSETHSHQTDCLLLRFLLNFTNWSSYVNNNVL